MTANTGKIKMQHTVGWTNATRWWGKVESLIPVERMARERDLARVTRSTEQVSPQQSRMTRARTGIGNVSQWRSRIEPGHVGAESPKPIIFRFRVPTLAQPYTSYCNNLLRLSNLFIGILTTSLDDGSLRHQVEPNGKLPNYWTRLAKLSATNNTRKSQMIVLIALPPNETVQDKEQSSESSTDHKDVSDANKKPQEVSRHIIRHANKELLIHHCQEQPQAAK